MTTQTKRILLGVLLVLAGGVFLLQQLLDIPVGGLFIAFLFIIAGVFLLFMLLKDREKWWLVIPSFTLIGIGLIISMDKLFPSSIGSLGGAIFLGAIALAFLAILILKPGQWWWPVIPAGVLITLAVIAAVNIDGMAKGGILFLGIGLTFTVLGLMPVGKTEKWPWIPASICLVLGILLLAGSGALANTFAGWVWALVFILLGAFFIIRSLLKKE